MKKTTLKEIKNYPAIDVTTVTAEEMYSTIKGKNVEKLYFSRGLYGINGLVFKVDETTYKICCRSTSLFTVL